MNLAISHFCEDALIRNMIGTLNEVCNFFKYSPKRNELLLEVIEIESPDSKKKTVRSLCKTKWVERHEAYEVFYDLLPSVLRALEVIANERLFENQ